MSTCNHVRDTQPAHRSPYDWNECGSSHALNAFYSVEDRLPDGERRRECRVCFTQRAREGKFHFFSPRLERSTLGGHGSDVHLTRVHLEDTTARSAPGGYGGQADLTGMEDKTGGVSTVSLNRDEGMSAEDVTWENQHRLQTGWNMSGGDFGGRLDRVGFWAGFSFVFSFLCRFSFLSCCLFRLLVGVCFRS